MVPAVLLVALSALSLRAAELANLTNGFSIRHERREVIGGTTRLYLDSNNDSFIDVPSAEIESVEPAPPSAAASTAKSTQAVDMDAIIHEVSRRSRLDADFIASIIRAESANNPRAVSRKGAVGLMQLMPGTAAQLGVKNSFDPAANVEGGVRYLYGLLVHYNYDVAKALAAYNAGPQRVEQYRGVPPYRETRAYVTRIINDYNRKKLAERKHAQLAKTQSLSAGGGE